MPNQIRYSREHGYRVGYAIVLKFAWRWAKVDDKVLVHDLHNLERALIPGVVAVVKRVDRQTRLGIRIVENGETRFVWPGQLFVHPDPLDPAETCWICADNDVLDQSCAQTTENAA